MQAIETTVALLVGATLATLTVPWIQKAQEAQAREKSAAALLRAGRGLLMAESEEGKLPRGDWQEKAAKYEEDFTDPAWKGKGDGFSGWGRNMRTGLALGETRKEDPPGRTSTNLPGDTILLAPWEENTLHPWRNGTMQPNQGQAPSPEATRHGEAGLYFHADHSVQLLVPEKAKERLALRRKNPSKQAKESNKEETKKLAQLWAQTQEGVGVYDSYILLQGGRGHVDTPAIPTQGANATLTIEASSPKPTIITITTIYLDKEGKEINVDPDVKLRTAEKHLWIIPEPANRKPQTKIGWNASETHAESNPPAAIKKGTKKAILKPTRESVGLPTRNEWESHTIKTRKIPKGTQGVKFRFTQMPDQETVIKNLHVNVGNKTQ
jgi:type II secretory pathway pseudopilin PulG